MKITIILHHTLLLIVIGICVDSFHFMTCLSSPPFLYSMRASLVASAPYDTVGSDISPLRVCAKSYKCMMSLDRICRVTLNWPLRPGERGKASNPSHANMSASGLAGLT